MAIALSACCNASIVEGQEHDPQPLGAKEYNGGGLTFKVDVCDACGFPTDVIQACESCGNEADLLLFTVFGDWCEKCITAYVAKDTGTTTA